MLKNWIGHHHEHHHGIVQRLPAEFKMAAAVLIIAGTVAAPAHWHAWFASIAILLLVTAWSSRISFGFFDQHEQVPMHERQRGDEQRRHVRAFEDGQHLTKRRAVGK